MGSLSVDSSEDRHCKLQAGRLASVRPAILVTAKAQLQAAKIP